MEFGKRGRPGATVNANGGFKKFKTEKDSLSSGKGTKSKPCMKFFSTTGCQFGENCHYLHYFPGDYKANAHTMSQAPPPPSRINGRPAPTTTATPKTKLCNKYTTPEGCKYGDKCSFAHGEHELNRHTSGDPFAAPVNFGASVTAKISVNSYLAGAIIGKGGMNSKQICRQTGVRLSIRDHENDSNLKNIELEGSFEQIQEASSMVRELILRLGSAGKTHRNVASAGAPVTRGNNVKTRLCEHFVKGSCTFGERCNFAHGAAELRG